MTNQELQEYENWVASLNHWEKLMCAYLEYAQLRIEYNENITEDDPHKYWLIDTQATWEASGVDTAADVFESHPSIAEGIIDSLMECADESDIELPDSIKVDDEEFGYGYAEYWAAYLSAKESVSEEEKKFIKDNEWGMQICELMVYHSDEVDLEKFI